MVQYNMILDITLIIIGPHLIILYFFAICLYILLTIYIFRHRMDGCNEIGLDPNYMMYSVI